MEFGLQHGRKQKRRMIMFENGRGRKLNKMRRKPKMPRTKPSIQLPFDIMVLILTKLPARHLRRFRRVCRSWNSLFCERYFIRKYLNGKKPGIVSLSCECLWQGNYSVKFTEGDGHKFDVSGVWKRTRYSMSNSCEGLICVISRINTYLVNPSIQKLRILPTGSWHCSEPWEPLPQVGLGFNASTGEYMVVRLFQRVIKRRFLDTIVSTGCEVYTLGDSQPPYWKVIQDAPLEPFSNLSVFVNGSIHWTVANDIIYFKDRPEIGLSFNVMNESFSVILHPKGSSRPRCSRLVELDGHLCISDTQPSGMQMDIWISKDYSHCKWIKQYSINLAGMYDWSQCLSFSTKPVTISDGKIVFYNGKGRRDYYDPKSKRFVDQEHFFQDEHISVYTESTVWPRGRITCASDICSF